MERGLKKCGKIPAHNFRVSAAVFCCLVFALRSATLNAAQVPLGSDWNPVEGPPAGAHYVGDGVCGGCHALEAKDPTPMTQAAARAAESIILRAHPSLTVHEGRFDIRITRQRRYSNYSVSDGRQTIIEPLPWAFGMGAAGQTYVFSRNGAYYQSLVSFYKDTGELGLTIGVPRSPHTAEEALGQRMTGADARLCFGCHTTGAIIGGVLDPGHAAPGVGCEACHGPGAQHVNAVQEGSSRSPAIFNPGRLPTFELDNFCGACHRTWEQVQLMGIMDVRNVRFQPYRLEKSRCWNATDSRIGCLACHNPHRTVVREARYYDSKCLACHVLEGATRDSQHPGSACPVSTRKCITCHMPRYSLPAGHFTFADHDIRVVQPNAPFPG